MEESRFDADHPLAGSVVVIEVPFDALDPFSPTSHRRNARCWSSPRRVRNYSSVLSTPKRRHEMIFAPWRRVGLDHVSYIDDARLALTQGSEPLRRSALTTAEWNALF